MIVRYGDAEGEYGPGVLITLDGTDVYRAVQAYLAARGVDAIGPQTFRVEGCDRIPNVSIYVDPSGFVRHEGVELSGRGPWPKKQGEQ